MKRTITVLIAIFYFASFAIAQTGSSTFIPELVFQNPVLTSGTAGQDGAIYKFSNVAAGIDATVKIKARSGASVKLTNIDVAEMGWTKAFQPQLGIQGNVPANQDWWMDFEMAFFKAGTTEKKKIKGFSVTAIDVDGDGLSIREYVQMNKVKTITYCPVNYLAPQAADVIANIAEAGEDADNNKGYDKKSLGPVQNFYNIDTAGTPVMSTYTYEDKDKISFRYGAKSGSYISNAGERLNSLWFKSFSLAPPSTLPVTFYSFTASYDKKNAGLAWSAQADDKFSHFVIEKSTNGTDYQSIGKVQASSRITGYTYNDLAPASSTGVVYYRIQCVEKSGEANYSPVKIIRLSKDVTASLTVYPNPVQKMANLTLPNSWQAKPVIISLYSSAGVLVKNIAVKAASQTETLDLNQLPRGMYVVKAQCGDEWAEQRILRN
ncbi:MAG TPA: T9SS type A sorting domain-containing protein [Flavisolibacter sp.]|jgi:hypothetical protein